MKGLLFYFTNNSTNYYVYKENNEYKACKEVNDTLSFDFDEEESVLLSSVFDKIKVSGRIIRLSNKEHNKKYYQHYYDINNNFNIFLNSDSSVITTKELEFFNDMYNNQTLTFYMSEVKNNSTFHRIVKTGVGVVIVSLVTFAPISSVSSLANVHARSKDAVVSSYTHDEKINKLRDAVVHNEDLSEDEKNYILDLFKIINYYIDYIDVDHVQNSLSKLKITYVNNIEEERGIVGAYLFDENVITIADAGNILECINGTAIHEFLHLLQSPTITNRGIYEPLTDILVNEFFGYEKLEKDYFNFNKAYTQGKKVFYAFLKLVDPESVIKYYFTGDIGSIIRDLTNIIDNESEAYDFLNYIDQSLRNLSSVSADYFSSLENDYRMIEEFSKYYEKKYNKSIYSDGQMMYYLQTERYLREILGDMFDESYKYIIDDYITQESQTAYFNKDNSYYEEDSTYNFPRVSVIKGKVSKLIKSTDSRLNPKMIELLKNTPRKKYGSIEKELNDNGFVFTNKKKTKISVAVNSLSAEKCPDLNEDKANSIRKAIIDKYNIEYYKHNLYRKFGNCLVKVNNTYEYLTLGTDQTEIELHFSMPSYDHGYTGIIEGDFAKEIVDYLNYLVNNKISFNKSYYLDYDRLIVKTETKDEIREYIIGISDGKKISSSIVEKNNSEEETETIKYRK